MTRPPAAARLVTTPRDDDLGLRRITNQAGLSISVLPNGCVFAIEHQHERSRTMINQVLGSALHGGIARLYLRAHAPERLVAQVVGPGARVTGFGASDDRFAWQGETGGLRHRVVLWLHPKLCVWLWRLEVVNTRAAAMTCDTILVQDVGLGGRGFLMTNEAYASQYIDHHVAAHPDLGSVLMSRQNLAQDGRHPWVAHGCVDGAASFATDALQLFGPAYRDADEVPGDDLPGERRQHEVACPMLQSRTVRLQPGAQAVWTFFALYVADHAEASSDADLTGIEAARLALRDFAPGEVRLRRPVRSVLQDAAPLVADPLGDTLAARYPERLHEERQDGRLLSFFVPDGAANRHVVLRAKEALVLRRHGALLRSGQGVLPDATTLCATCWMHGVFAAQLTIGNTSFHKLFSVSRDPYNITRASGLRLLVDAGDGWRLLAVPSVFEIGLSDCRWIYRFAGRTITVHAVASGEDPAMQWRLTVDGVPPCRFLVFGHLVLGERELDHAGRIEIDARHKRFAFRPDPDGLWGRSYAEAVYFLVTSTPEAIEAIGGDELLYVHGKLRGGAWAAIRTRPATELCFAVVGSLTDPEEARRLAAKYEHGVHAEAMLRPAESYWRTITRGVRITGQGPDVAVLDTIFPWLAHDAIVHLSVPHGLEQYTGAAWGTRDVCQGPVEFLLALEHDDAVREILQIVFAEQGESRGDWPQWFMLEPYAQIRDGHSHGDVIVWPLKALCDYIEATGDLGFLDEPVAWRREADLARSERRDAVAVHVDKLLATVRQRFIPGTHLIRYGEGDWNDSLQPVDPTMRDWMVSSWTVALLFQQVNRYAEVLTRAGRSSDADQLRELTAAIRADVNTHLIRAGTIAGYALFDPGGAEPELLLHPNDTRTGLRYALLPMKRGIIAGLFTADQAQHHLRLIREHLLFPDGARLMDRPTAYRGGPERIFRRAESSAFFGREIGLMYVHAHLRYGEALAALGEADALWAALQVVNPIAVTELLAHASPRQRNAYFSSSDAAFRDRYQAAAEWQRVRAGTIALDGGWRIYSSGPGLYTNLLLRHAFGIRRDFGKRAVLPLLPRSLSRVRLEMEVDGQTEGWTLAAT